jgi:hypothetical protein
MAAGDVGQEALLVVDARFEPLPLGHLLGAAEVAAVGAYLNHP